MKYILAAIVTLFITVAKAQQVNDVTNIALVCAYNASIPPPSVGNYFYVQCDSTGHLITSGGSGGSYTFSTGLTNTAGTVTLGDTNLTYSSGVMTINTSITAGQTSSGLTANAPAGVFQQRWSNAGVNFNGLLVNVVDASSGNQSCILNVQYTGSASMCVSKYTSGGATALVIGGSTGNAFPSAGENPSVIITTSMNGLTSGDGHGYDDETLFSHSTYSYNSYDARATMIVGNTYGHYAAFQARPNINMNVGNSISQVYGVYDVMNLGGTGTVTARYGYYYADVNNTGGGVTTTQYAIYIPALTGATTNWAFYSATAPSYTGGDLFFAKQSSASGTAPGAGSIKLEVVAGTNAGTCKIIAYAGTSTTASTVLDNIGSGC